MEVTDSNNIQFLRDLKFANFTSGVLFKDLINAWYALTGKRKPCPNPTVPTPDMIWYYRFGEKGQSFEGKPWTKMDQYFGVLSVVAHAKKGPNMITQLSNTDGSFQPEVALKGSVKKWKSCRMQDPGTGQLVPVFANEPDMVRILVHKGSY